VPKGRPAGGGGATFRQFFNFNFLINFKINPCKILFAPGDPFGRATCSGAAGVPRWLAAAREADVGPGLPRHMHWRGSAESTGPARPPFFFLLLPLVSPRPEAAPPLTAPPPFPAPNRWIWGGKGGGNRSPCPCEGIPLLLSLFHRCIM
jgi:hypothetical protein